MQKTIRLFFSLIGLVLVIDCVALMAIAKINFGTVVPCLIGLIFLTHGLFWYSIKQYLAKNYWLKRLWAVAWGLFSIWLISFAIFAYSLQQQIQQSQQPIEQVNAVIILGAGTINNQPSPTLAKRLDSAVPILLAQPQTIAITSGGVGLGDSNSSGQIMATYLHEKHNIPMQRVLIEGKSTSTEENFAFSTPILQHHGISLNQPIAVVTSDFHTIRSKAIAQRQGYTHPIMIASSTPLSIRYNAWFREYFAFISGWLLNEY